MTISDERVEAALDVFMPTWRNLSSGMMEQMRSDMRSAIEAADAAAWKSIKTADCNDVDALVEWEGGHITVEDLDHDSDPRYWAERGAVAWRPLPTPSVRPK